MKTETGKDRMQFDEFSYFKLQPRPLCYSPCPLCLCDPELKARAHTGTGGTYLWVVNPTRVTRRALVSLSAKFGPFENAEDLWQRGNVSVRGPKIEVEVSDRNAAVIRLK